MLRTLLLVLALSASVSSWAQSCPFWRVLQFSDGSKACVSDYRIADEKPVGYRQPLSELMPSNGLVALSHSVGNGCPAVLGAGFNDGNVPITAARGFEHVRLRANRAAMACTRELEKSSAGGACNCKLIVQDGQVLGPRAEFDQLFSRAAPLPAVAASAAGQQPQSASAVRPAATPPSATRAEAPREAAGIPDPKAAELAAMRQEIESLRSKLRPERKNVRALVVGNSRYASFSALRNPANDATAIAQKLRGFGIAVDLVLDADRDALVKALNDYSIRAAGSDVNILFYAGHGIQVEGTNYIVPTNMRADGISAGYVKLSAVSLNAVLDYLPAKTKLVFLDACRDNPAARSLVATRSASGVGLAPVSATSGTLIAYATRDGATADDGNGINSPYTTALLQHLGAPLDIGVVLRQVRQTVMQMTSNRQEPWEYGSLLGDTLILADIAK